MNKQSDLAVHATNYTLAILAGLVLAGNTYGQPKESKQIKSAKEILKSIESRREEVKNIFMEATIAIESKDAGGKLLQRHSEVTYIQSGDMRRIDYRQWDDANNTVIKNYSLCRGCTADNYIYYVDKLSGAKQAAAESNRNGVADLLLIDLRGLGLRATTVDNFKPGVIFDLVNEKYFKPTADAVVMADGNVKIEQKHTVLDSKLIIIADPGNEYRVLSIECGPVSDNAKRSKVTCEYNERSNIFPSRVEYTVTSEGSAYTKEVVKINKIETGAQVGVNAFSPNLVGLEYNAPVQVLGKKTKVSYFDGQTLSGTPPNPAAYNKIVPDAEKKVPTRQPENTNYRPVLLVATIALVIAGIVLIIASKRRSRDK
ncbi:hypothetical protein [Fimbriiglobus ruber]|uniref:hypothetical protein n=1 Tax=Fimbriiglobus ruber TaxID=1908690 RepID=UPI00117A163F|nr:hypothetical protein [Fimbriiglobus ruber]